MYEKLSSTHRSQRKNCIMWVLMVLTISSLPITFAESKSPSSHINTSKTAIMSACKNTLYQPACEFVLQSSTAGNPEKLFDHSVQFTMDQAQSARALTHNFSLLYQKAPQTQTHSVDHLNGNNGAMDDCLELMDDTLDQLTHVLNRDKIAGRSHDDVRTWLSSALTNQETCLESLKTYHVQANKGMMVAKAQNLSQFISNSLALYVSQMSSSKEGKKSNNRGRRLLSSTADFPTWVSASERKLLQASTQELAPHAVVAKDGSGTHSTIGEALGVVASLAAAGEGGGRTVIHVKAGTYNENLKIPTGQKNLMLVGDGKGITVIVGDKNSADGSSTFGSATFAAMGDGFIARDITFVNSAGPAKHQAVALRIGSDQSVIFRCSIMGYQDTLYTFSKRQFYRETDIYGTVDFIFGNSAVVFQSCNIHARKGNSGQENYVTAQGRSDPNQNTGISIQKCSITAESQTFLGRPWQKYSRTVIMQSSLGGSIDSAGWAPWSGNFALNTLYYGEYSNSGPGASTSGRVKWPGYHPSLTAAQAQTFTVGSFISGNSWLPSTGISFDSGLGG